MDDGYQDIDADGDPDLGFDGVLAGTVERLDAQMLLDPLEEKLDLRASGIQDSRYAIPRNQPAPPGSHLHIHQRAGCILSS